jgi:hypothetical protein
VLLKFDKTLSIKTLSVMTFSITVLSIKTLCIKGLYGTFTNNDTQHKWYSA